MYDSTIIILALNCILTNSTYLTCDGIIQTISDLDWLSIAFTALITGGAVVGGIFLTQIITSFTIRRRNSNAIMRDLHAVVNTLGDSPTVNYVTFDGWDICYVSRHFPIMTYQSIINSGELTHFSDDAQHGLILFLDLMESRNKLLDEIEGIYRIFDIQFVQRWRNLRETAELKELTVSNIELHLLNVLIPRLLSLFGGRTTDHDFFT